MPFQIAIDSHRQMATLVGSGSTDAPGFRAALLRLVADPDFVPGYRVLVDARDLDYTPTPNETRMFVEFHMSLPSLRTSKVAVVVTKLVDFGMANMFASLCELRDAPVCSFLSLSAAEEWLGTFCPAESGAAPDPPGT